jgi:hypothetical protein
MAATQEPKVSDATTAQPRQSEIDPTAPAGSKNSLGAESVRDGRPSTGDNIVEAIDEETPAVPGLHER